jgi:hypothetical protein
MNQRAGDTPTIKALVMVSAFASVHAGIFDLTITDAKGEEVKGLQRPKRSLEQLRHMINGTLDYAARHQYNVIIRPVRSGGAALLVQLDDLDSGKIETVLQHAFLVIRTSPGADGSGNHQAWVAVADASQDQEPARDFARRLRKGVGADRGASGAARIAGSTNFKECYAPNFPTVEITYVKPGHCITMMELERAGLVAAPEPLRAPTPPARSFKDGPKTWPSYDMCVRGAPPSKTDPDKPDYSLADFTWVRTAAQWGFGPEQIKARLSELSPCAKKDGPRYVELTVTRAVASVDRERQERRPTLNRS